MTKRKTILGADLFCGAGGTSQGMVLAANALHADLELLAINHWQIAVDTHTVNHPEARNLCTGVDVVDPLKLVPGGRLDILCASPECTHHSTARGGRPMNDQSRASAWHVARWAQVLYIKAIVIENVPEFQSWGPLGADGRPMKSKKGALFNQFIDTLKALGYKVDWRVLNCADYGAPTTRRRLFIIARRDGKKIAWPEPTHVPPAANGAAMSLFTETRKPWRTAREIIDWQRPSKDIFDRKKSLSPNTLRRISAGMLKFNGIRIDLEKCVREGLRPYLIVLRGTSTVASVDSPLPTVTNSGAHYGLVQPFLLPHRTFQNMNADDLADPLRTVTANSSDFALVEPFTLQIDQTGGNGSLRGADEPLPTVVTKASACVVEPFIVPNFGEREGQSPRTHSVDSPAPTVTGHGAGSLCVPHMVEYYGNGGAVSVDDPVPTVVTKDRFGLTLPEWILEGDKIYRLEIRFRMLQPRELARAQGFEDDYEFTGNREAVVKQIGNAVPPPMAAALCAAVLA